MHKPASNASYSDSLFEASQLNLTAHMKSCHDEILSTNPTLELFLLDAWRVYLGEEVCYDLPLDQLPRSEGACLPGYVSSDPGIPLDSNTEPTASREAARYRVSVSPGIRAVMVGSSVRNILRSWNAARASSVHSNTLFLLHSTKTLNNGSCFSDARDRNRLRAASFPLRLCISLRILGGFMDKTA
ncbi:hypothetical protein Tco_0989843 [Tanacetum coccineum]|uniref:Uncharacterized protein n=1 Tax=Tanacetum coccineum TaxID=301880 RepID=A0ABQ5EVG1_9ASTR